jgi:predicted PurR-regulated permease PerM
VGGVDLVQSWVQGQSGELLNLAGGGARGILQVLGVIAGVFSWVVLPVYLFFLLIAPPFRLEALEQFFPFLKEDQREDVVFLIRQFVDIVVVFFRGQLVIAFAQGLLMAVGFSLCGLSYGFILGLVFGMLNLVPYLGNLVGLSITLPLAWFQPDGGAGLMIAIIVVLVITQLVEGYVLTPKIMGKSTGLHPMAVIFAMFFWGKAMGGILGLILAIPLTAFLVVFWRLAKEKYLPRMEPPETVSGG